MSLSNKFLIKWMVGGSQKAQFLDAVSLDDVINQAIEMARELKTRVEIHQAAKKLGTVREIEPGKYRFEPDMENWAV